MERVNLLTKQRVQLIDPSSSSLCLWISDSSNHSTTVDVGSGFHHKARGLPPSTHVVFYFIVPTYILYHISLRRLLCIALEREAGGGEGVAGQPLHCRLVYVSVGIVTGLPFLIPLAEYIPRGRNGARGSSLEAGDDLR